MARYIADVRFIASIYPGTLPPIRRHYGPSISSDGQGAQRSTLFQLQPVPRGSRPFILPVHDSFEEVLDVMALSAHGNRPGKPRQAKPVRCEEITADLLNEWTGRLVGLPIDAKPGISEVHFLDKQVAEYQRTGQLPDTKTSGLNQEEYQQLIDQQTRYFDFWFSIGERISSRDAQAIQQYGQITETMRLAADWLGHKRPWTNKDFIIENTPCPLCTSLIPQNAVICPVCRQQIKALPPEVAAVQGHGRAQMAAQ